jgi:biopolymer transport protein TolR
MGMNPSMAGTGGGRRRRRRRSSPIADINMTPFIDVMLVLLIIFMVTAPLLTAGVPIDLPRTGAGALNVERRPITVSIDTRGKVFFGDNEVAIADLPRLIQAQARDGADERIYVRGARQAEYGAVAEVMAVITQAGFKRVALVTEQAGQR